VSVPRMPRPKNNVGPTDVRTIRTILSDVAVLTLAGAGVAIRRDELMVRLQRVREWYISLGDAAAIMTQGEDVEDDGRDGSDSPSQREEEV